MREWAVLLTWVYPIRAIKNIQTDTKTDLTIQKGHKVTKVGSGSRRAQCSAFGTAFRLLRFMLLNKHE